MWVDWVEFEGVGRVERLVSLVWMRLKAVEREGFDKAMGTLGSSLLGLEGEREQPKRACLFMERTGGRSRSVAGRGWNVRRSG